MSHVAHIVAGPNEFKLPWNSQVHVQDVKFGPSGARDLVATAGWDGSVYVYNIANSSDIKQQTFCFHTQAVLSCAFVGASKVVSGGVDNLVKIADIQTTKHEKLGQHDLAVRHVRYSDKLGLVVSGGWDSSVKAWDPRANSAGQAVQSGRTSDRVYAMDVRNDQVLVAARDRKIHLFDLRNMREPVQLRDSTLKYQIRAIAFFPSDDAFVTSSIEGRVAVEYISQDAEAQKNKYAFKCHREKDPAGVELVYPVNALAFHPIHSSFATGGSDAQVNIWDPYNRKRLIQFHKMDTSVVGLDISVDGMQIAIATSYLYEHEPALSPIPLSSITIRALNDSDVRIKN